jgi:hypothetical protein
MSATDNAPTHRAKPLAGIGTHVRLVPATDRL